MRFHQGTPKRVLPGCQAKLAGTARGTEAIFARIFLERPEIGVRGCIAERRWQVDRLTGNGNQGQKAVGNFPSGMEGEADEVCVDAELGAVCRRPTASLQAQYRSKAMKAPASKSSSSSICRPSGDQLAATAAGLSGDPTSSCAAHTIGRRTVPASATTMPPSALARLDQWNEPRNCEPLERVFASVRQRSWQEGLKCEAWWTWIGWRSAGCIFMMAVERGWPFTGISVSRDEKFRGLLPTVSERSLVTPTLRPRDSLECRLRPADSPTLPRPPVEKNRYRSKLNASGPTWILAGSDLATRSLPASGGARLLIASDILRPEPVCDLGPKTTVSVQRLGSFPPGPLSFAGSRSFNDETTCL